MAQALNCPIYLYDWPDQGSMPGRANPSTEPVKFMPAPARISPQFAEHVVEAPVMQVS